MNRWFLIRHVRWAWLSYRVHAWARQCAIMGLGLGYPNESDIKMLDKIWKDEA
jgi:hypothetical protein